MIYININVFSIVCEILILFVVFAVENLFIKFYALLFGNNL